MSPEKLAKIETAMGIAQEWRDENDDIIAYLLPRRHEGGVAVDGRHWNDIALEKIEDYHWALWGDAAPLSARWISLLQRQIERGTSPSPVPTERPIPSFVVADNGRVTRMMKAMLASPNPTAKVVVEIELGKPSGEVSLAQRFELRLWPTPQEKRIYVTIGEDHDWNIVLDCGVDGYETRTDNNLLAFAALSVYEYVMKGTVRRAGNGTIKIKELDYCGACGLPLEVDDAVQIGVGPECRGWPGMKEAAAAFHKNRFVKKEVA